jgi:hypothetical protein
MDISHHRLFKPVGIKKDEIKRSFESGVKHNESINQSNNRTKYVSYRTNDLRGVTCTP